MLQEPNCSLVKGGRKLSLIKRVAAVHDMSCVGRCSLTVIIPILSAMKVQVCPLPTAILSTHLGGFSKVSFCDFSDHMLDFSDHWKREEISFDCIYSGFLASEQQIDIVSRFIDEFSDNHPLVVVDPVMGDAGKLYSVYTDEMQKKMKTLIRKADILTPNYTEACFLLGMPYDPASVELDQLKEWLVELAAMGPSIVIITGIYAPNNQLMNLGFDKSLNQFWEVSNEHTPVHYPGTGDIFTSVLIGSLLEQRSLQTALRKAADFVSLAVKTTYETKTLPREGVLLEQVLPWLLSSHHEK